MIGISLSYIFFIGSIGLEKVTSFKLSILPAENLIVTDIEVNSEGQIFYNDYWNHLIYKFDQKGRILFKVSTAEDFPGPIKKPVRLGLAKKESLLIACSAYNKLFGIDASTGKFVEVLNHNLPVKDFLYTPNGMIVTVGRQADKNLFHTINDSGKVLDAWFQAPRDGTTVYSFHDAAALGPDNTIFYQEGTFPEVWVIDWKSEKKTVWELKIPRNYKEPPKKKMSDTIRYNKAKVTEYRESYTHLNSLYVAEQKYLVVGWKYPESVDIYDISTKKLLMRESNAPGRLVAFKGGKLYFLEYYEPENVQEDDAHIIHVMNLKKDLG